MGSSMSTNHTDRRTNALRRSQRKSITNACSNIDKLLKSINNFNGTEDSDQYKNLKIKIIQIEKNLKSKVNNNDIQPQFKTIHQITEEKIRKAHQLLDEKAKKMETTSIEDPSDVIPKSPTVSNVSENTEKNVELTSAQSPNLGDKRNSLLMRLSNFASVKKNQRNSVTEVAEVEIHKSPSDEKRKSIMKYGVPVLPIPNTSIMSNGGGNSIATPRVVSFHTPEIDNDVLIEHEKRLKIIKQDVANLEIRISEFVGKKNGKHYDNLKNALKNSFDELEEINEEELLDQVFLCRNYIRSCFDFLDSKAVDDDNLDDDVFTNYTDSRIFGSTHDLLENSVKTTAI